MICHLSSPGNKKSERLREYPSLTLHNFSPTCMLNAGEYSNGNYYNIPGSFIIYVKQPIIMNACCVQYCSWKSLYSFVFNFEILYLVDHKKGFGFE